MMLIVRKNSMVSRHPQHQGTIVGDCENDKGVGVLARRARHQVAGSEEDERVDEKDDGDCKKEMLWSPGIHSIKEPLLVVVRMTKMLVY